MTSSNGNIFRVTGPLCGEFTGPGEFPIQRPVTRSFDVFFDLRLNKRLNKQSWGWCFETLSCPFWRHHNVSNQHWFRYWLGAVRQQAIIRANVNPDLFCHLTSLGHNELTMLSCDNWACYNESQLYLIMDYAAKPNTTIQYLNCTSLSQQAIYNLSCFLCKLRYAILIEYILKYLHWPTKITVEDLFI